MVLSLGTGLIFGIVPAIRASAGSSVRTRLSGPTSPVNVLVVAEVALSFVLLAAAGLLVHKLRPAANSSTRLCGGEPSATFRLSLPPARFTSFAQGDRFFDGLSAALKRSPVVQSVATIHA